MIHAAIGFDAKALMMKTNPKHHDKFTDQKRAEAEKQRRIDSVAFLASIKPSKWFK